MTKERNFPLGSFIFLAADYINLTAQQPTEYTSKDRNVLDSTQNKIPVYSISSCKAWITSANTVYPFIVFSLNCTVSLTSTCTVLLTSTCKVLLTST